jgi:hypothetical protein
MEYLTNNSIYIGHILDNNIQIHKLSYNNLNTHPYTNYLLGGCGKLEGEQDKC